MVVTLWLSVGYHVVISDDRVEVLRSPSQVAPPFSLGNSPHSASPRLGKKGSRQVAHRVAPPNPQGIITSRKGTLLPRKPHIRGRLSSILLAKVYILKWSMFVVSALPFFSFFFSIFLLTVLSFFLFFLSSFFFRFSFFPFFLFLLLFSGAQILFFSASSAPRFLVPLLKTNLCRLGRYTFEALFSFSFFLFLFSFFFSCSDLHRRLSSSSWWLPCGYQFVTIWSSVMIGLRVVYGGWRVGQVIPS